MEWCLTAASWEWESRSSRGLSRPPGGGRCSLSLLSGSGSSGPAHFHWRTLTEGAQTPRGCFSRGLPWYRAEGRSPVSTEAGTSRPVRPPQTPPQRRARHRRQRRRGAQVLRRSPWRHGLSFHCLLGLPPAVAWATSAEKARVEPRLSTRSLLVKWVCSCSLFLCPLARATQLSSKSF